MHVKDRLDKKGGYAGYQKYIYLQNKPSKKKKKTPPLIKERIKIMMDAPRRHVCVLPIFLNDNHDYRCHLCRVIVGGWLGVVGYKKCPALESAFVSLRTWLS
jgi:hypothetical protein